MTAQSKAVNKGRFETGDIPTQTHFADLIDSYADAAHTHVISAVTDLGAGVAAALANAANAAKRRTAAGRNVEPPARLVLPMGEVSYFNLTGAVITIGSQSDGSTNMVGINPATTFSGYQFDNGGANDGIIRYLDATTRMFHIAATLSGTPANPNDLFVIGVAKNGTVEAASKVIGSASGTQFSALHLMTMMNQSDTLQVYIGNVTAARNFTLKSLNLFAMGL